MSLHASGKQTARLCAAVFTAAILWFWMFSPLTRGILNFWLSMSVSALVLTAFALDFRLPGRISVSRPLLQAVAGVALAVVLWGIFWVGDKLSSLMFDFARPGVDALYSMKQGLPQWAIALLLLFVIGPAEEFFWRGYVQRTLAESLPGRNGGNAAFLITAAVYALIHVPSMNFMLVMAALVAGAVWGFIYRLCPKALPALVLSHALWDALVFIIFPI